MGRPAEKRRRKKERQRQLDEDVAAVIRPKTVHEQVGDLPDDALFFIDEGRDEGRELSGLKRAKNRKASTVAEETRKAKAPSKPAAAAAASAPRSASEEAPGAPAAYDLWAAPFETGNKLRARVAEGRRRVAETRVARTFVEAPGCSYNPSFDDHQDAVAAIVAADRRADLSRAARLVGPSASEAAVPSPTKAPAKAPRASKRAPDPQRFVSVSVKKTLKAIRREEREHEARLALRRDELKERRKVLPPRLGKRKFVPEEGRVMATDEIDGSLRTVKAAPMALRSVQNKLERRGLLEPRGPARRRRRRRVVRM